MENKTSRELIHENDPCFNTRFRNVCVCVRESHIQTNERKVGGPERFLKKNLLSSSTSKHVVVGNMRFVIAKSCLITNELRNFNLSNNADRSVLMFGQDKAPCLANCHLVPASLAKENLGSPFSPTSSRPPLLAKMSTSAPIKQVYL